MTDTSDAYDALWASYFDATEDIALPNGDVSVPCPDLRCLRMHRDAQGRLTGVRADLPDVSRGVLGPARRAASRRGLHGYDVVSCDGTRRLITFKASVHRSRTWLGRAGAAEGALHDPCVRPPRPRWGRDSPEAIGNACLTRWMRRE